MLKTNILIQELYKHTGYYIIKANNPNQTLSESHYTYNILADALEDITTEVVAEEIDGEVYRIYNQNYRKTISFISKSGNEDEAYEMIIRLKDALEFELKNKLYYDHDIVVLNVTPIKDVTVRFVDNNEYRFNLDVELRFSRETKKPVGRIEEAKFKWR